MTEREALIHLMAALVARKSSDARIDPKKIVKDAITLLHCLIDETGRGDGIHDINIDNWE